MGFNVKKFARAKFTARTETVSVPVLAGFFEDGESPDFVVRGLTGEELARVNIAKNKQKNMAAVIEALAGGSQSETVREIRDAIGMGAEDLPEDLARRIEMLLFGCIEPVLDAQLAAKLFRVAPVEAYSISNAIIRLSGQGMTPGEPPASGDSQTSRSPAI